jgi:hypothetical protein
MAQHHVFPFQHSAANDGMPGNIFIINYLTNSNLIETGTTNKAQNNFPYFVL